MARTKSTKEEIIIEETPTEKVEPTKTTKTSTKTVDKRDEEIEALKKSLAEAMDLIKSMQTVATQKETKLGSDDNIVVISQCVGALTISTEGFGRGTVYDFLEFGEIQDIPFGDLKDIVRNNRSFAEKGYFYIANEEAVKQLRLERVYNKLLKNEDMLNLFNINPQTVIELYKLAPEGQKKVIIDLIVDKKLKGETVDANILLTLGELSGKDLIGIEA